MKIIFLKSILVLCLYIANIPLSMAENKEALTFGIVPQQTASKLARLWIPIMRHLSEKTGVNIHFRTAPSIPEFERRLSEGVYDIAYMNPYHYVVFSKSVGYRAFAKQSNKRLTGIVVVRKDSSMKNLMDINNKSLAFPSPAAFAATIIPRAELHNNGVKYTPKYVLSHDSVYRTVASGIHEAGGGITRTLNNLDENVRSQLKVLWQSKVYTPHAFASHSRVKAEVLEKVSMAMQMLDDKSESKLLLKAIRFKGIESAKDSDWNDIRALNIQTSVIEVGK